MPRVVRMMAHVETDLPRADVTHVYLHGAARLRTDLTRVRSVPDDEPGGPPMPEPRPRAARRGCPARSRSSAPACSARPSALACRRAGVEVVLADVDPEHVRTATGLGAGRRRADRRDRPGSWSWRCRRTTSRRRSRGRCADDRDAVVTDVGQREDRPRWTRSRGRQVGPAALARYVGGHPMAGSERSGPLAATRRALRRPALGGHAARRADPAAVAAVRPWPRCAAPSPVRLTPEEHDLAVARTSHLPAPAGRARRRPAGRRARGAPRAVGPGRPRRDPRRGGRPARSTARSSPATPRPSLALLGEVRGELDALIAAVARRRPRRRWSRCSTGASPAPARSPASTAGRPAPTESVFVSVPDHPGELARLFADAGEIGVNIEDVHIDHDPGRPVGLVELTVDEPPGRAPARRLSSRAAG